MPFYDENYYYDTLKWDDVFTSASEFETKVVSIGGVTTSADLQHLYEILSLRYANAYTRYTYEFGFIQALKRELYTEFPYYLEKKDLVADMIATTDDEIRLANEQLRNLVDQHDEPVTNADTVAIDDLSTQQENIRMKIGKLQSIRDKYNLMNRDFMMGIWKRTAELFRVILSDEVPIPLYETE